MQNPLQPIRNSTPSWFMGCLWKNYSRRIWNHTYPDQTRAEKLAREVCRQCQKASIIPLTHQNITSPPVFSVRQLRLPYSNDTNEPANGIGWSLLQTHYDGSETPSIFGHVHLTKQKEINPCMKMINWKCFGHSRTSNRTCNKNCSRFIRIITALIGLLTQMNFVHNSQDGGFVYSITNLE